MGRCGILGYLDIWIFGWEPNKRVYLDMLGLDGEVLVK